MAKRFSKINFVLVSILVIIGLFLAVCSFDIPFGVTNDYAGFAGAISQNYDLGDGQTAVYEVTPVSDELNSVSEEKMNETTRFMIKVLDMFGLPTNQVGVQNINMIRAEIQQSSTSESFLNALSNRIEIVIRAKETTEATELDVKAERIKKCSVSYQASSQDSSKYTYGVLIEFDSLGSKQYEKLTEYASDNGETVYFYNSNNEQIAKLTGVTKTITTGNTFLENTSITTESEITNYAAQIMMGAIDVNLTVKENSVSSAYLGYNSVLYIAIGLLIAFVAVTVFMIVRYRDLGLISMLTSFINIILYLFFLQALPNSFFTLSIAGVLGAVLGFALTIISHIIIFENIKKEYAKGRRIPLSFKLGFKNSTLKVVDVTVLGMITSVVVYIFGFNILKSFAVSLLVGSILAIFSSLVLTKVFTKWYLPLNSTKPNRIALKKETSNE